MFYILRHGQTDWNLNRRLQGSTDIPLNATGREQARKAATLLETSGLTRIIASPLSRALETAQIVGAHLGIEPLIDPRLIERNFGLFEGMTIDEVEQHRTEMRAFMRRTPISTGGTIQITPNRSSMSSTEFAPVLRKAARSEPVFLCSTAYPSAPFRTAMSAKCFQAPTARRCGWIWMVAFGA